MAVYNAGSAAVRIRPDASGFAADLRDDLQRIQVEYNVDIVADATGFGQQLNADLSRIRTTYDVDVGADLTRFHQQVAGLSGGSVSVNVDGDLTRLRAQLLAFQQSTTLTVGLELGNTAAFQAQLAALLRNRTINVDVNGNGLSSLASGASRAHSSLSAMSAVKFTALASAITSLVPVILGAAGAAGGLTAALGAIGGVGAIGISGLSDTFSAIKDQSASAGDAAQEMADKQQAVTEAAQAQESAQRDLADAQQSAKDAQKDLTDSYEDARRALRDMNDELVDATLNQEEAEIALAEAQQERNKTYSDPTASGLDRAKADLRVDKAAQRLKEAKSDTSDKRKDTAEANAKGIEGSDQVTAAKKNKADADQSVVDAQNKLATAAYNLSKAQRDLASGTDASDKVAQAMAKLAPSAQDFVRQMQALGPSWTDMRKAVQEKLFDGLGDSVTRFAQTNLPGLKAGLSEVAGYMNGSFKQTLSGLSTEFANLQASGQWQGLINAAGSALSGMAPMITGLTNALVTMGAAVGPALGPFFTQLGELIRTLGPALGQLGATLLTSLTAIAPTLGQFLTALATGLGPVLPVLATLINSLGQALIPLIPPLSQVVQIIGNTLAQILPVVAPFFAQLVQLAADLLAAVTPLLPPLLQLASAILTPLVGVLQSVVGALAPFIQQIADFMGPVIEKITPLLQQMGDEIGQGLADAITQLMPSFLDFAEAISGLEQQFLPLLPDLARIAADLLPLMLTQLELILPVATKFIIAFSDIVERIMPYLIAGLDMVADGIEWFSGKVSEFVSSWTTAWDGISLKADDVAKWLRGKFDEIVGFVSGLKERVKTAASDAWEGLKDSFRSLINWIFSTWNDLKLTLNIPLGFGQSKSVTIDTPNIKLLEKAGGGPIVGAGGPTDDRVPLWGSNGEWVHKTAAVNYYGPQFMDDVNNMRFPRDAIHRATGGPIGKVNASDKTDFQRVGKDRWNTAWARFFEDKTGSKEDGPRDALLANHPELQRQYREGHLPPGADLYMQPDWKERLKLAKQRDGQSGSPSGTPDPSGTPAPSGTPSPSTTPPPTGTPSTTGVDPSTVQLTDGEKSMLAGGTVNTSIFQIAKAKFPNITMSNSYRAGDPGYHGIKKAIDFEPNQALADFLYNDYRDQLAQIIWNPMPSWFNVRRDEVGTGTAADKSGAEARAIYGEGEMAGHGDHVHVAASDVVKPKTTTAPTPNGDPNNPYANPDENRNGPQKYTPDGTGSGTKSDYPTTISGWAGLAASGFTSGFVSDALGVLGIPDSPSFITGMKDLSSQVRIKDPKTGKTIWGTYTPPTTTNPNANGNNGNQNQNPQTPQPTNPPATPATGKFGYNADLTGITDAEQSGARDTAENKQVVQVGFGKYGWDQGQLWTDSDALLMKESGYRNAVQYQGPVNSDAYGMFQFLSTTWAGVGGHKTDDPRLQTVYGREYIKQRYGDPSKALAFHLAHNWYDDGGWLEPGFTLARNETGQPEAILTAQQWANVERALNALPPQRPLATAGAAPASGRGGSGYRDHIEYHIATARVEDAFYEAKQREDTRAAASINRY